MWYPIPKNLRQASHDFRSMSKEDILKNGLFHGTAEEIDGDLRGGGYDKVLWHANNPAAAQSYIPESGSRVVVPRHWGSDRISIDDDLAQLVAKKIGHGYAYDVERDNLLAGNFLEATKHLHGENSDIKDLVKALHDLLGDEARVGGQLGIMVNHALQGAGINRLKFQRLPADSHIIRRLYNDKYEEAESYIRYDMKSDDVAQEVSMLVSALSHMMENPGWYAGSFETIKTWGCVKHY